MGEVPSIKVDVRESQGAEECFLCEEREEADQDQAKEEDHRGGEHCCFENPAIRL